MRILRLSLAEGARAARGVAVVIDVFRAFTCEPVMYACGAKRILLEGDVERCFAWKDRALLVGERDEVPIDGFDLTNSPSQILARGSALFAGRTVVHRTTAGVTGALAALAHADAVFLASYITARATVAAIRARNPAVVSIVAMGIRAQAPAPEDERCGDYIEALLSGDAYDHLAAVVEILRQETAQKFLRGDKAYLPREDPALCLQRDLFDFALEARQTADGVEAVRVLPDGTPFRSEDAATLPR
ncbi:MAG: 2-phosphosulfolactate phosphatase [Rhodospirillales bacterium]|nr:2-phosphosulfolactate phosphatase [Rhodospirillales bacterium]